MLSEAQSKAILDLKLNRLTGLERDKIHEELVALGADIKEYLSVLSSREKLYGIMREELVAVKDEYATPRLTTIEDIESLIQREEMVVTVTEEGYIKRVPLNAYKAQKRGGKSFDGFQLPFARHTPPFPPCITSMGRHATAPSFFGGAFFHGKKVIRKSHIFVKKVIKYLKIGRNPSKDLNKAEAENP